MAITVEELNQIRKRTLNNAIETISSRNDSIESVEKAADIALVSKKDSVNKTN